VLIAPHARPRPRPLVRATTRSDPPRQIYDKLRNKPAGNIGGEWNPATFEVEDSAFGFIRMKNGATIFLEASWALNVRASREACVTLCGTEGGADSIQVGGGHEVAINSAVGELVLQAASRAPTSAGRRPPSAILILASDGGPAVDPRHQGGRGSLSSPAGMRRHPDHDAIYSPRRWRKPILSADHPNFASARSCADSRALDQRG
jgi:predicted dehydrogenase